MIVITDSEAVATKTRIETLIRFSEDSKSREIQKQ